MKLLPTQIDEASLGCFGREVVSLLESGDFQSLADRFGYALALGKNPVAAIEDDFESCRAEFQSLSEPQNLIERSIVVKYFKPDSAALFAVVECVFVTQEGCLMLADLIVTSSGKDKHITLEHISRITR